MNNQQIQLENYSFNQYPKTFVNRLDKEKYGNFTQVFNHIIDAKISKERNLPPLTPVESKLLENILAKKDGWSFSVTDMAERVYVGVDAIKSARKKLVQKGYLKIIKYMNKFNGRFFASKYIASDCAEFLEENQKLIDNKKISFIEMIDPETFNNNVFLPPAEIPPVVSPASAENSTNNTISNNTNMINTTTVISKNKNEVNNKDNVVVVQKEILKNKEYKEKKNEYKPSIKVISENKDSLTNTNKEDENNDKKNIPPVPVSNCGQVVDECQETIQELKSLEINTIDSKHFIKTNGLNNVKEIIQYIKERKQNISDIGAYTSSLLRKKISLTKKVDVVETPKKLNLKLFTELFNEPETKLNDHFRTLVNNFVKYNIDIDTRVQKKIEMYKNTPAELQPQLARQFNIFGIDESLWIVFIKDQEEKLEKKFREKISLIKSFDIDTLESMKLHFISNHINDNGLFEILNI